jgi:heterodisulfide reductase subunit C
VFRLVLVGTNAGRLDLPFQRLVGAVPLIFGQRKVLQSVSLRRDRAGLAHFLIFWGFLSFLASYLLLIYGDSISDGFSAWLLTDRGIEVFAAYLDILALGFFVVLAWAAVRRWAVRPSRLVFDLTQKREAAIILVLIAQLMAFTLLTEAFYTAAGGTGPHAAAPVGSVLGDLLVDAGVGAGVASDLHAFSWWTHLFLILGFSVYIPLSKHMHIVASPLSFVMRSLEPRGTLATPMDLETADSFGASKASEFTQKELLDGFACAVCGRCTDSCSANLTEKLLSPMHIVENLKEHVLESRSESKPLIGGWIPEEALWDCLTCGACVQECPAGVEHIDSIVDMRRHLVMERAEMPEAAANALMSLEQRGHPWHGTTYTRTDWAKGLAVPTLAEHPDAEVLF